MFICMGLKVGGCVREGSTDRMALFPYVTLQLPSQRSVVPLLAS